MTRLSNLALAVLTAGCALLAVCCAVVAGHEVHAMRRGRRP